MISKINKVLVLVLLALPGTVALALTPQGYVSDFANILGANERTNLEASLRQLEENTGHELAVVTVESLEGQTIEGYAVELFEEWRIGKTDQDNGVLLLVAPNEREVRIEVGYGLEPILTDSASYWIIQGVILPPFRDGNYFGGIDAGVETIRRTLTGEVVPGSLEDNLDSASDTFPFNIWNWLFLPFMYLVSFLGRSKSWWLGGIAGGAVGLLLWWVYAVPVLLIPFLILLGLLFDYTASQSYRGRRSGSKGSWWTSGGHGSSWGGGGGGFGGFGGGSSGGGGASGRW